MNPTPQFPSGVVTGIDLAVSGIPVGPPIWLLEAETIVHAFIAENDQIEITVATSGFETSELGELLAYIGPINDRPDLLEQYKRQTEERFRELGYQ